MIKNIFKDNKAIHIVVIASILLAASNLRAEESTVSKSFTDGTKEYLADPARTGSLVGSILAGAAIANPFAPLLGGVAGFFIGKTSDYSGKPQQSIYANRRIIPNDAIQVTSLAGLTGTGKLPQKTEHTPVVAMAQDTITVNQSEETQQPAIMQLTRQTGTLQIKQQLQLELASACSNVAASQPLPIHCYYYSQ